MGKVGGLLGGDCFGFKRLLRVLWEVDGCRLIGDTVGVKTDMG